MDKILGVVNLHSEHDFGNLTNKKGIATTSFLGRYYFIDLLLSRFANCNINSIEVLIKNKPVSLFKHLSVGAKEWSVNTQIGGINFMYNELETRKSYMNTDFNTLLTHKNYLKNYNHAFVLVAPCEIVSDIDYQKMMESHILSGKLFTVAYKDCSKELDKYEDVDKLNLNEDQSLMKYFKKDKSNPNVYMETFIIHRTKLIEILDNFDLDDEIPTLKDVIEHAARLEDVNVYKHEGFMRYFRNLENYIEYSLEMLEPCNYEKLFNDNNRVYTRGYNTVPTLYGKNAYVNRCFVSNGCNIEGKVTNSILGRNIIIEKDAIVNNCIIFSNAHIKAGCVIEDAIIENGTIVESKTKIKGNIKKPAYIQS